MKFENVRSMLLAGMCAVGLATLVSCGPAKEEVAEEPEAPAPAAPAAVAHPSPAPARPLAIATPEPDPLAPPGIFFLLQAASITTEDGIIGLKPGQGLRRVAPGSYEVNGQTVQLRDDQVTNNLRLARHFAASDAASQAALRQALQPPPGSAPAAVANSSAAAASATPAPRVAPRPAAPPPSGLSGARLGAGTGAADPETANRRNVRTDSSGRQYWRDSRGGIRYDF